jgi:hypothetical protein
VTRAAGVRRRRAGDWAKDTPDQTADRFADFADDDIFTKSLAVAWWAAKSVRRLALYREPPPNFLGNGWAVPVGGEEDR